MAVSYSTSPTWDGQSGGDATRIVATPPVFRLHTNRYLPRPAFLASAAYFGSRSFHITYSGVPNPIDE